MKVIKIGGGSLKTKKDISDILDLVAVRGRGDIIVVSALNGVTDRLIAGMSKALQDEASIPETIVDLKNRHLLVAKHLIPAAEPSRKYSVGLLESLGELERLYYGLNFTREITPRMADVIGSFGERLCVDLLVSVLRSRGHRATYLMPHKIGLLTDGRFGDATALLPRTSRNLQARLKPLLKKGMIVFIPGFFGVSEQGDITTFGRGGSDYSAAVVAAAMVAEVLEVWKDVPGYMSADPKFVPEARLIPVLSYDEAAELSYFGAKILHPRTVEPLRKNRLSIAVKNTLNPDAPGSLITSRGGASRNFIKSVAHDTDIAILKVHASGVGARPGVLARVAGILTERGINIKSVVTSQTCISFLLARKDLQPGYAALGALSPRPYRRLERIEDVALVGIVGAGLLRRKGIAARCFSAVAECGVNVEMISFGPSPEALYFLVREQDLQEAVRAIHDTFFPVRAPGRKRKSGD
ncbi:MAG: aspartate kinase [Deltaproteobacteria bacterium]|nr:aspartate kinase [Deltaproteobacteria bacterium]